MSSSNNWTGSRSSGPGQRREEKSTEEYDCTRVFYGRWSRDTLPGVLLPAIPLTGDSFWLS